MKKQRKRRFVMYQYLTHLNSPHPITIFFNAHIIFPTAHKQFGVNKNEMISIWIRHLCVRTIFALFYVVYALCHREYCLASLRLSSFFNLCLSFATILSFSVRPHNAEHLIHIGYACGTQLNVLECVCVLFQNLIQILLPFFTIKIRKHFFVLFCLKTLRRKKHNGNIYTMRL